MEISGICNDKKIKSLEKNYNASSNISKNSIDFINKIEKIYINDKTIKEKEMNQLNNYKSNLSKEYIKVINYIPKTSLSSLIFKKGMLITCMAIKLNNIYIGTNKGEVRAYSWKTEKKLNYFIHSEIERESKRDVICMDASEDNKVLVVGHLNGYILLWDVNTAECKKIIQDEFKSQIVAIKFTLVENHFYEFLASDLKGSVKRLGVNEGFFFSTVNSNYVIDYTNAIFIIEVLQLTKEQKKIIYKYNNSDDIEEPLIVAFGALDFVFIVQLEPEIKRLYNFKKPSYIKSSFVPDICFGIGRIPAPNFYSKDLSEEDIKKIKIKDLKIDIKTDIDINKNYQLILVSWGKIIFIYMISFDLNDFLSVNLIGNYINNEPIIRMGFLSNNIIYILNLYKKFKILNTSFMNSGEIKINSEGGLIGQNFSNAELCSEFSLDFEILFQTYIPDLNNSKNLYKSTYNNFVFSQNKVIFAACKKNIYLGCLLNWEQCINELFKNSEWLEAFRLGIDIYHGENKIMDGIPMNIKERKEKVKRILKGLILQLILNTINIKGIFYNEKKSEEILSKCLNASFELCIDVKELDFLLKEILPILEEKGYLNFFIKKIKPFLLERKITAEELGQNTMSKILKYYININDYVTLSQIILNINREHFDIMEIKDICNKNNIFLPLIYINFKYNEEELFSLIEKIYGLFKNSEDVPKNKYFDFQKEILNHKINNKKINEIFLLKQYLGQKLFWLISLCLDGKKYPNNEKIDENIYISLIQEIFLWLINDEILNELVIFDSYTFYLIFYEFFKSEQLLEIIKKIKYEENKKLFKGIILKEKNINKIDIAEIIEILLNKANKFNNVFIYDDMNEFILKINSEKKLLKIDSIIKSINYLLNFKSKTNEREKIEDYFEFHKNFLDDDDRIDKYSLLINKVLENYKNKIDKKELNKILILADKNEFPFVCIKILNLLNENIKCLDVYLDKKNNIKNKEEKIFEFINDFMNKAEKEEKKMYIKDLIERADNLVELSVGKFLDLNLKWLNNSQSLVLEKLSSNNEIKLKYIEQYINYYNDNNIDKDQEKINIKGEDFYKFLIIHIETLCKMDKKKDILSFLKKENAYINNDILKICLNNKVFDAAIYILMKQENFTEALELCKKEITSDLDYLVQKYIKDTIINKYELFSEHDEIIDKCCVICEKESEQLPKKERKRIWFDILEFLYKKIESINLKEKKVNKDLSDITKKISEDINIFILKMYPYTDMKSLLEEIFKKSQMTEFSGFNNILYRFVKEQIIFKNIFNDVKSLLDFSISDNYQKKNKYNIQGTSYILEKCDFCHKIFNDNDDVLLLKCGHISHKTKNCCININNKYNCKICYIKELKESVGSIKEENSIKIELIDNYIENNKNDIIENINKKDINKNNNLKDKIEQLKLIEAKFNKINFMPDIDIEEIKNKKK